MKTSTITAQQSVISLQAELLECREKKLESVQSAVCNVVAESVQSEMKSYSAAVTANQKTPAIKTLTKAIKQAVQEEDRSKNILVFGLPEGANEDTNSVVDKVFECVGEKPRHESVRIGLKTSSEAVGERHRPIKVRLSDASHVIQILRVARKLKETDSFLQIDLRRKGSSGVKLWPL